MRRGSTIQMADIFRTLANEGKELAGKTYEKSGARCLGIPVAEILAYKEKNGCHHPARKVGKICELALGFSGGNRADGKQRRRFKGTVTDRYSPTKLDMEKYQKEIS